MCAECLKVDWQKIIKWNTPEKKRRERYKTSANSIDS